MGGESEDYSIMMLLPKLSGRSDEHQLALSLSLSPDTLRMVTEMREARLGTPLPKHNPSTSTPSSSFPSSSSSSSATRPNHFSTNQGTFTSTLISSQLLAHSR